MDSLHNLSDQELIDLQTQYCNEEDYESAEAIEQFINRKSGL